MRGFINELDTIKPFETSFSATRSHSSFPDPISYVRKSAWNIFNRSVDTFCLI